MGTFNLALVGLCLLGFLLSSYAYSVEVRAERAKESGSAYRAYCDVGPFSCTKVFSSEFGSATQFFGLPKTSNALVGMAYYTAEMLCCWNPTLILLLSAPSIPVTLCLAFILTVVLHDLCFVCCSIYVVNLTTVYVAYRWWKRSASSATAKKHV
ncbi:Vitamin K epoxide reductase family [Novymonas esmeraldas]|uniref:vitamin-K-epoxide reductase (warfarin-sensitive) n=1 Tax=Novymonas esmeraldas TaxID=1808958 RepID=A0AAW0EUB4_9TRYP